MTLALLLIAWLLIGFIQAAKEIRDALREIRDELKRQPTDG